MFSVYLCKKNRFTKKLNKNSKSRTSLGISEIREIYLIRIQNEEKLNIAVVDNIGFDEFEFYSENKIESDEEAISDSVCSGEVLNSLSKMLRKL